MLEEALTEHTLTKDTNLMLEEALIKDSNLMLEEALTKASNLMLFNGLEIVIVVMCVCVCVASLRTACRFSMVRVRGGERAIEVSTLTAWRGLPKILRSECPSTLKM